MSSIVSLTEFKSKFNEEIRLLMSFLVLEIKKELREQGHVLTGTLERSIEYDIKDTVQKITYLIYLEDYGLSLDRGIASDRIPFSPGSGAGSSKYIEGLKRFWMLRGLPLFQAERAAFATARKHKQEGMPTRNSYSFSSNGRRLGFFSGTIERHMKDIEATIERSSENVIIATLTNVLTDTTKAFM